MLMVGPMGKLQMRSSRYQRDRLQGSLNGEASEARQILNDWDPIPGNLSDEYDGLVNGGISARRQGAMYSDLAELIPSKLRVHFELNETR